MDVGSVKLPSDTFLWKHGLLDELIFSCAEPASTPILLNYLFNNEEMGEAVCRHWLYCCVHKLPEMVIEYPSYSGGTTNDIYWLLTNNNKVE
jgi:hypothetical protein